MGRKLQGRMEGEEKEGRGGSARLRFTRAQEDTRGGGGKGVEARARVN